MKHTLSHTLRRRGSLCDLATQHNNQTRGTTAQTRGDAVHRITGRSFLHPSLESVNCAPYYHTCQRSIRHYENSAIIVTKSNWGI